MELQLDISGRMSGDTFVAAVLDAFPDYEDAAIEAIDRFTWRSIPITRPRIQATSAAQSCCAADSDFSTRRIPRWKARCA
jgi:hypothetical protein